jgi:hypothetical protein
MPPLSATKFGDVSEARPLDEDLEADRDRETDIRRGVGPCRRTVRPEVPPLNALPLRLSAERLSVPSIGLSVSGRSLKGAPHPR